MRLCPCSSARSSARPIPARSRAWSTSSAAGGSARAWRDVEFFASSTGSVHGVALEDGRRVVVKAHRAGADVERLAASQRVQAWLAERGYPAPLPLVGPAPLGRGTATAEALLDRGAHADAHDPAIRVLVAAALARLHRLTQALEPPAGLHSFRDAYVALWETPHDPRFDFAGTEAGAEWIDGIASAALWRLERSAGQNVVGHSDWRVEHLRFVGREVTAVYDWDSLTVGPEPVFAGAAAHGFTADWTVEGSLPVPTYAEALAFIADYEAARGTPFTDAERRLARAGLAAAMAYSARCEHSDRMTGFGTHAPEPVSGPITPGSFLDFLAKWGPQLLAE